MISVISEIIEPIIRLLKDRKINQLKTGKQNTGNNIKNGTEPKPTVSFYVIRLDLTFLRQFSIVIRIVISIVILIVGLRPVIPPSHRGHGVNTGQYTLCRSLTSRLYNTPEGIWSIYILSG